MSVTTNRAVLIQTLPVDNPAPLTPLDWLRLSGLAIGLVIACHFYGVGLNLIFIVPVLVCVGTVLLTISPSAYALLLRRAPLFTFGCLVALLSLGIQHTIFSVSVDTSFAPTLIAACLPLAALAAMLVCSDELRRQWLLNVVCTIVFVFACVSAWDYIAHGQRAHAPLWDPNNYVTLLYLAWLPWLFVRLAKPLTGLAACLNVGVCFVVCLAMLATHSRVAMLIVAGALVGLVATRWWYRLSAATIGSLCLGCLVAVLVYLGVDSSGATAAFNPEDQINGSENQRLLMISSTLEALRNFGTWAGTGLYTFTLLYPIYRSPLEQNTTASFVHNDYLQLLLETGVWGLSPFLFLLIVVVVAGLRRVVFTRRLHPSAGALVALGCAMLHAAVNFVVYILPLTLMMGLLLGMAFAPAGELRPLDAPVRTWLAAGIKWVMITLVGLNAALLGVDSLSYGVFSGQLHVPGAAGIRRDSVSMLNYARLAQDLNPSRGIPVLAEAQIVANSLRTAPSKLGQQQANLAYRRALAVDPWNNTAYISYAAFLRANPELAEGDPQEQQLKLLSQALALNPAHAGANRALLNHHIRAGNAAGVLQVMRNGLQWCETMRRSQASQADALLEQFAAVAQKIGDQTISDNVTACGKRNYSAAANGRKPTALMRWLRDQR